MVSLLLSVVAAPAHQSIPVTTVFAHAILIDGNGGAPISDSTIAIADDRVTFAGKSNDFKIPAGAKVIDCKGKWVIPGLFDMHTHVDDPELIEVKPTTQEKEQWMPLFVLMGVTGIREMAGDIDLFKAMKRRIASGELLGPRVWHGGPLVDGPRPMWPESIAVQDPESARHVVRSLKARGADFIKVYSLLGREEFLAICDEAKKVGLPVCGHVPGSVSNKEACEAGLNSIEHLLQLDRELADPARVSELRTALPKDLERFARFKAIAEINEKSYSPDLAKEMFSLFKSKGAWIDPTLTVVYQNIAFNENDPEMSRRRDFVPAFVRVWWNPSLNVHLRNRSEELKNGQQAVLRTYKRIVAALRDAGIPLMTGSDMGGNPHCFAGWGVHDEMSQLVSAGLTPMEAIVSATSNPAKYLNAFDKYGSIEPGKSADFVILNADPLRDIRNSQSITTVVYGGKVYDKQKLDALWTKQREAVRKRL